MPGISKVARAEARALHADGLKRCSKCREIKRVAEFSSAPSTWDRLSSQCRQCVAATTKNVTDRYRAQWATEDPRADSSLKRCPGCDQDMPRLHFALNPSNRDGLGRYCSACYVPHWDTLTAARKSRWATEDPYSNLSPKRCGECRQERPRSDFSTAPSRADGLYRICNGCAASRESEKRARLKGQWVEYVDRNVAWELAGGICYLCNEAVPRECFDLDHVDPVVNGGEHSYFNTAPTHASCNRSKGGKPWPDVSFDPAL